MLVFYWAETPLEDVEKVCGIVKLFIRTGGSQQIFLHSIEQKATQSRVEAVCH